MSKHQPGPWTVYQDTAPGMEWNRHIHWAPNMTICFMAHSDRKDPVRDEANANLVAAAPDLYEAAISAKDFLIGDLEEPGRTVFWKLIEALKKAGWSASETACEHRWAGGDLCVKCGAAGPMETETKP